ncbi:MAG: hypothetical protein HY340_03485 [Candidatus Kerfeldbacteria bacterium]|nr:hypothetical protein [Candidatus Kerfeldbacteria bacterium]
MTIRRAGFFGRRPNSTKPAPKRFSNIPLKSRQKISRDQLGAIVGRMLGGNYRNEKQPWESRRAVRDLMKETGHYDTIKGKTKFNEQEAVQIIKDFRAKLKERRKEQGFGPTERGDYYGVRGKDVYRKFIEETYNQTSATTAAEQRRSDEEMRVRSARRRELQRQQLGLTSMTVRKLTSEVAPRAAERRAGLEQRLEASRQKSTPGLATTKPPASPSTAPGAIPSSAMSHAAGGAPFATQLHLPPRHAADRPASEVQPPQPPTLNNQPSPEPPENEQDIPASEAEESPVDVDENLPL